MEVEEVVQILRMVVVIGLVCFAAALATPPGRLPLALRGLQKILRKDAGQTWSGRGDASSPRASPARRLAAFLLVLLAAVLALV